MPYNSRAKRTAAAKRRWERIKSDPELLAAYRNSRAAHERTRRARDPYRGVGREKFLADARRHCATRRARKAGQFIEEVDPSRVYEMHGGRCGICGQFIDGDFHVDHVIPLAKGGMHGYTNVQPAHPSCNWRKGDRV